MASLDRFAAVPDQVGIAREFGADAGRQANNAQRTSLDRPG